jgi:sugar phosphate isomerase/epimerase
VAEKPRYNPAMRTYTRRDLLGAAAGAALAARLQAATPAQLRLGVTTDEIDDDTVTAIRFLRRFGLAHGEVRNLWGKYNTEQPVEKVQEAQKLFHEYGVQVSIVDTPFFKIPLPPETAEGQRTLDKEWKLLDGAFERARILGTDQLRVFAFTFETRAQPDRKNMPRIYELVREAARRAKKQGFRLALENVGDSYVWRGAESGELLKHVKEDALGLTWDPNNAAETGEKSFPEGYRQLDPARIFHVHLRDFRKGASGKVEWCPVGEGDMDNLGQIRALLKDGCKGTFSLETHWRSPKGKAFATETSLTALLKVVEKV